MCESKFRPKVLFSKNSNEPSVCPNSLYMEGLIMRACAEYDIRYSNAFLYLNDEQSDKICERYEKIQNSVYFNVFSKICRDENIFCDKLHCHKRDALAAKYLLEGGLDKKDVGEQLQDIYGEVEVEESNRTEEGSCGAEGKNDATKKKTYHGIRYVCITTGYDEIAFPVKLYNIPMGVLIVGQILTNEHKDIFEKKIRDLYRNSNRGDDAEKIINEAFETITYKIDKIIDSTVKAVAYIEKELRDCYEERQRIYSLKMSDKLIANFNKALKDIEHESESSILVYPTDDNIKYYNSIGDEVKKQLNYLCDIIAAKERAIFIPNSKNMVDNIYDRLSDGKTVLRLSDELYQKLEGNVYCGDVSDFMENCNAAYDFLLVSKAETYPVCMAVRRVDFLPEDADIVERKLLKNSLKEIFTKFSEYAQKTGIEAKSEYYRVYLESSMSIMRHELGQSNAGYQSLIEKFKQTLNDNKEQNLKVDKSLLDDFYDKCDIFIRDSEKQLKTTELRIKSTKHLIDFELNDPRYFYPYDEFLFKWQQIYYDTAEKERLKFRFPVVSSLDLLRPMMYGDPNMIEQAAFNLTNNAIKYAIYGTQVSLDCKLNKEEKRYEIIVKNIGHKLKNPEEEKKAIFGYGVRGTNNEKEGSGLGLYLTRKIAEAHEGGVKCEVEEISDYDLSLLTAYIVYYESSSVDGLCDDEELYYILKKETEEKKDEINKYIINPVQISSLGAMYTDTHIDEGTALYTFTFWVPYKE